LECLPRNSRVAVLRLRSLGDCVLSTPALAILKRHRPDLHIAVAVEDRFRAVFEGSPDLDDLLPADAAAVRRFRPSLCLNLHGGTRSAWITALSGASYRAGFSHFRHQPAYNVRIPRAQEILGVERAVHTAEHLATAMFYLGVPPCEVPRAKLAAAPATRTAPYAVIHAVAASAEKTWPPEGFLRVAEELAGSGLDPVFIGAASDDLSPFRRYRTIAAAPFSDVKSLLAGASLFVGNDSGPAHIAAAFGVPAVVIFLASDPAIWGPWRTISEIIVRPSSVEAVMEAVARLRVHA
jgi:ADP-heptose:LPS heptosyltransferase